MKNTTGAREGLLSREEGPMPGAKKGLDLVILFVTRPRGTSPSCGLSGGKGMRRPGVTYPA